MKGPIDARFWETQYYRCLEGPLHRRTDGAEDSVRRNARTFAPDLRAALKEKGLGDYALVRTRVIYFRDVAYWNDKFEDTGSVWAESDFFSFPKQQSIFENYVNTHTVGGQTKADKPESSYECFYKAMKSEWFKKGDTIPATDTQPASVARDITPLVILWTDADPKPVNDPASRGSPANPKGMPDTNARFSAVWADPDAIDRLNKLFVLFGPCASNAWQMGLSLPGSTCGGSVSEGNTRMIPRIVAAVEKLMRNRQPYLAG